MTIPTNAGVGKVLTSDANGNASWQVAEGGLTNFTESNYTYDTKTGVKFTPNNAATNVDVVLQPKGDGAIIAQQPDGTTVGGNKRGANVVDLQLYRSNSTHVASGDYSTIIGGIGNIASGENSTVMGYFNTASGQNSVAMGANNIASGALSTAMGFYTIAPSPFETVLGAFNTEYTPYNSNVWYPEDRLFVIGNGTLNGRSNALTILKNGNTTISGSLTAKNLSLSYTAQTNSTNLTNVPESIISVNADQTITNLPTGSDGKIIYLINSGTGTITLPSSLGTILAGKVTTLVAVGSTWYRVN